MAVTITSARVRVRANSFVCVFVCGVRGGETRTCLPFDSLVSPFSFSLSLSCSLSLFLSLSLSVCVCIYIY